MKSARAWLFALGAIVLCVLLVAIIGLFVAYAAPRAAPVKPLVTITSTVPEGSAVAGHPVVVFGQATDPGGIAGIELWVNGQKVAGQDNPNPGSPLPFETSQAWIPNSAGNYLLTLKATNTRKFAGESDPVLIVVGERSFEPDPQLTGEYIVAEGDTWESIASGPRHIARRFACPQSGCDRPCARHGPAHSAAPGGRRRRR